MSGISFPTAYYYRLEDGTHAVICPICGNLHIHNNTGVATCFQNVESHFSIVAPFTPWQHEQAEAARKAVEEVL